MHADEKAQGTFIGLFLNRRGNDSARERHTRRCLAIKNLLFGLTGQKTLLSRR